MEQMQILLAILVLLPFVSALLLALCGSDRMRRLIVYGSAGALMISAVAFAVCFFSGENLQLRFLQSGGIIDHTMLALEVDKQTEQLGLRAFVWNIERTV